MHTANTESLKFVDSLKKTGVSISNEHQLRERLSEVSHWKYALFTLISNGKGFGISFMKETGRRVSEAKLHKICEQFALPSKTEFALISTLKSV
ncbi:MAG TPA: hypothetical protein VIY47_13050 [Ignavibacteriaceae bacterium]